MSIEQPYKVVISDTAQRQVESYLNQLKSNQQAPGAYLKAVLDKKGITIDQLSTEKLIDCLLQSKPPKIFAENPKLVTGDNKTWNKEELKILGDVNITMNATVHDNGQWFKPTPHQKPFSAGILYTPGALLKNENSPDLTEVVKNGQVDKQALKALYERRLLPLLLHANQECGENGQKGFVAVPGLGCGEFAGIYKDQVVKLFPEVLKEIIKENKDNLPNISGYLCTPEPGMARMVDNGPPKIILDDPFKSNLLSHPGTYGAEFQDCKLYKVVAWDQVSWPGNDFYEGNTRYTDDGVTAAATNTTEVMTGVKGKYVDGKYMPPDGFKDWKEVIDKKGLSLTSENRLSVVNTPPKAKQEKAPQTPQVPQKPSYLAEKWKSDDANYAQSTAEKSAKTLVENSKTTPAKIEYRQEKFVNGKPEGPLQSVMFKFNSPLERDAFVSSFAKNKALPQGCTAGSAVDGTHFVQINVATLNTLSQNIVQEQKAQVAPQVQTQIYALNNEMIGKLYRDANAHDKAFVGPTEKRLNNLINYGLEREGITNQKIEIVGFHNGNDGYAVRMTPEAYGKLTEIANAVQEKEAQKSATTQPPQPQAVSPQAQTPQGGSTVTKLDGDMLQAMLGKDHQVGMNTPADLTKAMKAILEKQGVAPEGITRVNAGHNGEFTVLATPQAMAAVQKAIGPAVQEIKGQREAQKAAEQEKVAQEKKAAFDKILNAPTKEEFFKAQAEYSKAYPGMQRHTEEGKLANEKLLSLMQSKPQVTQSQPMPTNLGDKPLPTPPPLGPQGPSTTDLPPPLPTNLGVKPLPKPPSNALATASKLAAEKNVEGMADLADLSKFSHEAGAMGRPSWKFQENEVPQVFALYDKTMRDNPDSKHLSRLEKSFESLKDTLKKVFKSIQKETKEMGVNLEQKLEALTKFQPTSLSMFNRAVSAQKEARAGQKEPAPKMEEKERKGNRLG